MLTELISGQRSSGHANTYAKENNHDDRCKQCFTVFINFGHETPTTAAAHPNERDANSNKERLLHAVRDYKRPCLII